MTDVVLVINAGSSSIKFQVFETGAEPVRLYRGKYEGLGGAGAKPRFSVSGPDGATMDTAAFEGTAGFGHEDALVHMRGWLTERVTGYTLIGVGHRVVHGGMDYDRIVRITPEVITRLDALAPLAPLHQPHNLAPIRIIARLRPEVPQFADFDTAFHRSQPEIAQLFAVPRALTESGVRRYGFHGLSYAYLASVFPKVDERLAKGRVVAAHLGNGASMCAMRASRSIASTMGFSALDGLPMGTRCGNLDPAVVFHMMRTLKLDAAEAEQILYTKSGLLGVSGLSNDMRELRGLAAGHPAAQEAIDLFTYRIGRELGSLTAALGGIDALVFTGGIGENDAATRAAVVDGAGWTGFALDAEANAAGRPLISSGSGPQVFVIPTDEERMIARDMHALISQGG